MTLREAVEIERSLGRVRITMFPSPAELADNALYQRALAIVDAAVEFVDACDGNDADDKLAKLRALERDLEGN
jgi:hypothetical protein